MRTVKVCYSKGVGAIATMRALECEVDDQTYDGLLKWATGTEDHEHTERDLELVPTEKKE